MEILADEGLHLSSTVTKEKARDRGLRYDAPEKSIRSTVKALGRISADSGIRYETELLLGIVSG